MTNIAIENGHINSEFSHEKWWFPIVMLVYQRLDSGRSTSDTRLHTPGPEFCTLLWIKVSNGYLSVLESYCNPFLNIRQTSIGMLKFATVHHLDAVAVYHWGTDPAPSTCLIRGTWLGAAANSVGPVKSASQRAHHDPFFCGRLNLSFMGPQMSEPKTCGARIIWIIWIIRVPDSSSYIIKRVTIAYSSSWGANIFDGKNMGYCFFWFMDSNRGLHCGDDGQLLSLTSQNYHEESWLLGTRDVQASQHPVNDQVKLRSRLPQTDPEKWK